ncbi:potassium channel family protein [Tropicimonas sp. IMCC6043]|uniref:potassium channel family protein n=1 Tax=Tropicimonas sp. IMCC6043 TaxID=2510645 RepID=UPI00101C7C1E|nr:potassium channel family protein [Tropicimonas sp. IMCC6043]RYH12115.1 potassium channel protein [Tropicimonas sp. IMCC6043]
MEDIDDQTDNIRWGALLTLLVAAFLVGPVLGASRISELVSLVLFELAVIGSIFMGTRNRRIHHYGSALALLWFVTSLLAFFGFELEILLTWLTLALVFGALFVTFLNLLRRDQGNIETLLGAVFGYLLIAMAWAILYLQIERWHPGSFAGMADDDTWSSLIYYSLVTLTTLGYGDILPITAPARLAAGFEAVVGVLYIAVMIGSIVSDLPSHRSG